MMRRPLVQPVAVIFLCALALSACANDKKKISLEQVWAQDKQQFNTSLEQVKNDQLQAEQSLLQQADALADAQKKIAELEQSNQSLQAQLKAVSSRMERLHRKKKTKARKPVVSTPKPIAKTEPKQRTTPVKALPPALPAVAAPKVDAAAQAEAEKNTYTSAYLALKSGRYDEAANGFNKQLDLYPDGEYADQAWYWLGETRLAQNGNDRALNAFKYVADHFPNSVKHAAALLKLGQISEAQNHYKQSALFYKRLIHDHVDSPLAEQAREALGRTQNGPNSTPKN